MSAVTTPEYLDKPTKFYVPFAKVDKANRMVYGFASTETLDADGESIAEDAIAEALPNYMKFANIREMHQPSAVGKAKQAAMMTKGGKEGLYVGAKIVDPEAWMKIEEGVYQGFSVGGQKLEKRGNIVTKIHLSEISVVDRPANPDCTFDLVKRDEGVAEKLSKATQQKDFKVQTLVMSKDRFKTSDDAKAWAKKNGFNAGGVDEAENTWRVRQFDPKECKANSHRTFELTDGVQATGCTAPGVKEADMPEDRDARVGKLLMKACTPHGGLKKILENPSLKKGLMGAAQLLGHLDALDYMRQGAHVENAMKGGDGMTAKDLDDACIYFTGLVGQVVDRELAGLSKPPSPDPKTTPAPGGDPSRKEAAEMPGTTTDDMKAHKEALAAMDKELAEMEATHKDDAEMSEAIKEARAHHAKLHAAVHKHDAPPGDGDGGDGDGEMTPHKKLAAIHDKLKAMSESTTLAGTKTHKNAAGDPSSNDGWHKEASEAIGNLAKAMVTLAGEVTTLKKVAQTPKTRRLVAVGKESDMAPELLAKVEAAVAQAEKDKDPTALIKLVRSGAISEAVSFNS